MDLDQVKQKRAEAEKQREQALASANFCAGMVKAYDDMIAAAEAPPDAPPAEEGA